MLFQTRTKSKTVPLPASHPHSVRSNNRPSRPGINCPDMVSLVAFNTRTTILSPFVGAFDAGFATAIKNLPNVQQGYTNVTAGLRTGIDLLAKMPSGLRRRLWLLTDGDANAEEDAIPAQVQRAVREWININTIGFGDPGDFNRGLLTKIAGDTHNGRYFEASTVAAIGDVFRKAAGHRPKAVHHRGEAAVFVIDTSGSMFEQRMGGRRRIDVVQDALYGLVMYKQQVWS